MKNIRNLAGCFEVTYKFAEDGRHDLFNPRYGLDKPIKEWIDIEKHERSGFVLTHYSITGDGHAVPHWHGVWRYRPEAQAWTQTVWSRTVDNAARELRYRCTAPWTMNRWQCHAGKASKPFRDSGAPFGFKRTDYEFLDRENILLVTENGWIHNEHNKKIDTDGEVVAYELGWITYRRLPDKACKAATE